MKMLQNLTLTLLINLIFMFSTGKCVSSCIYKEVGNKVVIPFDGVKLQAEDDLRWTHNERRIYYKRTSQIKNKELSVDQHGSLILENVQKDTSGEYKGIVFNVEGRLIKNTTQQLCVQEPVSEPTVMVMCVEKEVHLTCSPLNNDSTVVSWMKNGKKASAIGAILHVNSSELKSGDKFSCTVSNNVNEKSAKEVKPECSDTGHYATTANNDKEKEGDIDSGNTKDESKKLFGVDLWLMLVILTGGGSFLILFIICLVCVCCSRQRNKRKAKEEEEYRLANLMPDQTNQPDEQYMQQTTSQRVSKSQRPLPPLPIPHDPSYFGPT